MRIVRAGRLVWVAGTFLAVASALGDGPAGSTGSAPAAPASAPALAPASGTPTADAIIKKYVEFTGGEVAIAKVTSRVIHATLEIQGAGFSGKVVITQMAPNKMLTLTSAEEFGENREGTDGVVAWEMKEASGAKVLDGAERADLMRRASLLAETQPQKFYEKLEVAGAEQVGEQDCWVVVMTPKVGDAVTNLYDKSSGMLVQSRSLLDHPMGKKPMITTISDYREVDGVKLPFKSVTTIKGLPIKMISQTQSVEHNTVQDEAVFALPDDIKELLKKDKPAPADAKQDTPKPEPK